MNFLWPNMLWLLLAVPVLIGIYILLLRRKKKFALRYASLSVVKEAMGSSQRLQHLPPLLFLLAMIVMIVAIARPTTMMTLPTSHETIILAVDVSGSMRASDVAPTRLAAAQAAVRTFVSQQPSNARIGVVSFASTASVVQPPTENRDDIIAAIDRLQLQRGTAVGSGLLVALKTIFPDVEFELNSSDPRPRTRPDVLRPTPLGETPKDPNAEVKPVPPGSFTSAAIILLTDGQTTTGPDPVESSHMAAERGVRVYTVGIGTPNGEVLAGDGWSMRVSLDEDSLKQIAKITDAEYFYAGNATDLTKVYKTLNSRLSLEKKETEITALFSAVAAALALLSALLSMMWFNRVL